MEEELKLLNVERCFEYGVLGLMRCSGHWKGVSLETSKNIYFVRGTLGSQKVIGQKVAFWG